MAGRRDLEMIAYDLAYYGEDPDIERIIETVARLLEELARFALRRCCFTSVGGSRGHDL